MNKVIISGRLTRDPEVRYSQTAEPIAIVRFTVACNRKFKKENEPDADFINCVAFGKTGEVVSKFFTKGRMIGIVGSIRTNSWTDNSGQKRYSTDIFVEEVEFLDSKASSENKNTNSSGGSDEYYSVEQGVSDDDLPF